jgi:hypothetical protein
MSKLRQIASLLLLSAMLTACGGGGGSSASAQSGDGSIPPVVDDPSSDPDIDPPDTVAHATVSWTAPIQREDGSELPQDEIAGYQVYHIEGSSGEMEVIDVEGDITEYRVALAAGSHELAVAVIDIYGYASQMSDLQTIEVN